MEKTIFKNDGTTPVMAEFLNGLQDKVISDTSKLGDLATLSTTSKDNLVNAINELATNQIVLLVLAGTCSFGYSENSNTVRLNYPDGVTVANSIIIASEVRYSVTDGSYIVITPGNNSDNVYYTIYVDINSTSNNYCDVTVHYRKGFEGTQPQVRVVLAKF